MTEFNKAIKHIKTCLFWDFADGQWLDTLYTPLDRDYFNRLMQGVVEAHEVENAKLRELVALMYRDMQGVLDMSTDTVWVDDIGTLRDEMDCHMQVMAELGMPPADYERRIRELGVEVDDD